MFCILPEAGGEGGTLFATLATPPQCALCPVGVEEGGGLFRLLLLVSSCNDSDSLFILQVNLFRTSSMDLLLVTVVALPPLLLLLFCVTVLLLLLW